MKTIFEMLEGRRLMSGTSVTPILADPNPLTQITPAVLKEVAFQNAGDRIEKGLLPLARGGVEVTPPVAIPIPAPPNSLFKNYDPTPTSAVKAETSSDVTDPLAVGIRADGNPISSLFNNDKSSFYNPGDRIEKGLLPLDLSGAEVKSPLSLFTDEDVI